MKRFYFDYVEQYLYHTNARIVQTRKYNSLQIEWIPIYSTLVLPIITVSEDIFMYKDYKQTMIASLPIESQTSIQIFYKDVLRFYKENSNLISAYLTLLYVNEQPSLYEKEYSKCIPSKQQDKRKSIFYRFCAQKDKMIQEGELSFSEYWKFIDREEWIFYVSTPIHKINYVDTCLFFVVRKNKEEYWSEYVSILTSVSEEECKYIASLSEKCVDHLEHLRNEKVKIDVLVEEEEIKSNCNATHTQEDDLDEETRLCIERLLLEDQNDVEFTPIKEQVVMRLNDVEEVEEKRVDLYALTVPQLREMCKERDIRPIPRLKADCIAKLREIM